MRNDALRLAVSALMIFSMTSTQAQSVAQIDFDSVGRGVAAGSRPERVSHDRRDAASGTG